MISCAIPFLIARHFILNLTYRSSIKLVNKKFVLRDNALHNENGTVIYTPNEKIDGMDNLADKRRTKKKYT